MLNSPSQDKYTIHFNGKTFETKYYQELSQEQYETLREEHYRKPSFESVCKQFIDVKNGKCNTGLITKYYLQDLREKTRKKKSKFSVEEVFSSRELVGFLVGKSLSNPKVYNSPYLIKNIETVCRIGGSGCVWASASNFPMETVDMIVSKYNRNGIVYDFSCGWGNRMLGCLRNGVKYVGTDPNYELVDRLNQMRHDFDETTSANSDVDIRPIGSEELIPEWGGQIGLAFSSPPYYDEEDYVIGKQSYSPGKTYEEWLDTYMLPSLRNIYTYLIKDGVFCINVKNCGKYQLEQDTIKIADLCGFELFATEKLKNHQRPHAQLGLVDNSEKIYCFKKKS